MASVLMAEKHSPSARSGILANCVVYGLALLALIGGLSSRSIAPCVNEDLGSEFHPSPGVLVTMTPNAATVLHRATAFISLGAFVGLVTGWTLAKREVGRWPLLSTGRVAAFAAVVGIRTGVTVALYVGWIAYLATWQSTIIATTALIVPPHVAIGLTAGICTAGALVSWFARSAPLETGVS